VKKAKIKKCDIYIPHLNYTVKVRTFTGRPPSQIPHAEAYVDPTHVGVCTVYFRPVTPAYNIVHEITHILKFMCIDRHMSFVDESEHMAYLAQYLMLRITGGNYVRG